MKHFEWLAERLVAHLAEDQENTMSVEVRGLADTIRKAKLAIAKASDAAARMQASAGNLTGTLAQVDDMTDQLDAAHAELQGAVGMLSNGGPPLDPITNSSVDTSTPLTAGGSDGLRAAVAAVKAG